MKNAILFLFTCLMSLSLLGQSQVVNFGMPTTSTAAYDVTIDSYGNHVVLYRGDNGVAVGMAGPDFAFKWSTDLIVMASGEIGRIITLPNNTFLGYINQDQDYMASHFFCLDSTGTLLWHKRLANASASSIWEIALMQDGSVAFTGGNGINPIIGKIDSSGNIVWCKTASAAGSNQYFRALTATSDGGLVAFCDIFDANATMGRHLMFKYGANGTKLWERSFEYTGRTKHTSVIEDDKGNLYCIGEFTNDQSGTTFDDYDINIEKYNANGDPLIVKHMGGQYYDGGGDLIEDRDGNIIAIGTTLPTLTCNGHFLALKMDTLLDTLYAKTYGNLQSSAAFFYDLDRNGDLIYTAGHGGPWSTIGGFDGHLIKTDTEFDLGCYRIDHPITVTDVPLYNAGTLVLTHSDYSTVWTDVFDESPSNLMFADACTGQLLENNTLSKLEELVLYPNPVNDELHISGDFSSMESITVDIIDLAGRLVQRVSVEPMAELVVDVSLLQPGNYLVKLSGNGYSTQRSIIIQ